MVSVRLEVYTRVRYVQSIDWWGSGVGETEGVDNRKVTREKAIYISIYGPAAQVWFYSTYRLLSGCTCLTSYTTHINVSRPYSLHKTISLSLY